MCGHAEAGANFCVVTDLEPASEMRFAVQAYLEVIDSGFVYSGWSDWSNWIKTDASPMQVPDRLTPQNGSIHLSPDCVVFSWNPVPAGYGYRLQIVCDTTAIVDWQRIADTVMVVRDILVPGRQYSWRVQSMDEHNVPSCWSAPWVFSTEGVTSANGTGGEPFAFQLRQNYPNPFNPATTIEYSLSGNSRVRIEIYSELGQGVAALADEGQQVGLHSERFEAGDLSSGVYFIRLTVGSLVQVGKCVLLR